MILGPQYHIPIQAHPILDQLEELAPGVEVHGWYGRRWYRLRKIKDMEIGAKITHWQVRIAYHSAWLLPPLCGGLLGQAEAVGCENLVTTMDPAYLLDYGNALLQAAVNRGELRPAILDTATPYQRRAPALVASRPWVYLVWPPGSGKTPGALACIGAIPGDVLILCPAGARKEWKAGRNRGPADRSSVEKFSTWESFRLLPTNERRKGDEPLDTFLARKRAAGERAIVVAGLEAVPSYMEELEAFRFQFMIIDELHQAGDNDRWTLTSTAAGSSRVDESKTAGGEMRRSVALMHLSQRPEVTHRLGLSGTPLDDGRPRRLWAPLDLLSPGGFGTWSAYRGRYCGVQLNAAGHLDDGGESNMGELRARTRFFLSNVTRPEVRTAMAQIGRAFRLEVTYLDKSEQNKPDAFAAELKRAAKALASTQGDLWSMSRAKGHQREAELAMACSCKRKAILARVGEFLKSGGKVVILMARCAMVEKWAKMLREAHPLANGWGVHEDLDSDADEAVDAFHDATGASWLIGTGHKIGTSKNGMQCADLGVIAQLPEKPGLWDQWIGRFDRMDGKGTLVWVPLAEGTRDDIEATRLTRKYGSVERFLGDPEVRKTIDALDGTDDVDDDAFIAKLVANGDCEDLDMG